MLQSINESEEPLSELSFTKNLVTHENLTSPDFMRSKDGTSGIKILETILMIKTRLLLLPLVSKKIIISKK